MQRVLGSLVVGLSLLTMGRVAAADPESGAVATPELGATQNTPGDYGPCLANLLEQYARRKAFTLHLLEQREQQQFDAELSAFERRREFTERLTLQRAQLSEAAREQFDAEVERVTRLREFTLRLQDERDLRDALAFAEDMALQERKRAFTRRLVEARAQRAQGAPEASGASTAVTPE